MTKTEIAAEELRLDKQIADLEAAHPSRDAEDWFPWHAGDDALSLEHWALVQRRLNLKHKRPERVWTDAQKKSAGIRLHAARQQAQDNAEVAQSA